MRFLQKARRPARRLLAALIATIVATAAGCGGDTEHQAIEELRKEKVIVKVDAGGHAFSVEIPSEEFDEKLYAAIERLPHLKTLLLARKQILEVPRIPQLNELETLDLSYVRSMKNEMIGSLQRFPRLTNLALNGTRINDKGVDEICELKRLKTIGLVNTRLTDKGIARIKQCLPGCLIVH